MTIRTVGALAHVFVFALLTMSARADDPAASIFAGALNSTCKTWLAGTPRDGLDGQMNAAGWQVTVEGSMYSKSGAWGTMTAMLTGDDPPQSNAMTDYTAKIYGTPATSPLKRACQLTMSTNAIPWTTAPLANAVTQWVGSNYSGASVAQQSGIITDGHPVDGTQWTLNNVTTTMAVEREKQPDSDVVVTVEQK